MEPQVSDVASFDLDREDLLVGLPLVVPEPSLLLREGHGGPAAEEVDDLGVAVPFHDLPEVPRGEGPQGHAGPLEDPPGLDHARGEGVGV